jgi:hypothetical protein
VVHVVTFGGGRPLGTARATTRLRDLRGALRSLAWSAVLNEALTMRWRAAKVAAVPAGLVRSAPSR